MNEVVYFQGSKWMQNILPVISDYHVLRLTF